VIACAKMSSAANEMMLMSGKCRPWYSKNKYVRMFVVYYRSYFTEI
jgi:hypothetical protein